MKWPEVQFADIAEIITGNTPPKKNPENYGSGVPWVKPPDLDGWEPVTQTSESLSPKGQKLARLLPEGTVMVCCIGSIGRVGIAGTTLATNQQINSLIFGPQVEPKFGYYYCRWIPHLLQATARNAVVPILNKSNFSKLRMPLPVISEQLRIVEILDQADALRKKRAETDSKAACILPALFHKMFGDPATNMYAERWPLKRIDAVSDVSYGLSDRLDSALTADKGTRIITISNVTIDGQVDASVERYTPADDGMLRKARVIRDDLLFNWRNGSKQHIGKTAIWEDNWPGDVLHVSFLLRIRPNKEQIEPYYLWALINLLRSGGFFTAQSRMQINSKFNASELSALRIPVPPQKLQKVFTEQLRVLRAINCKNTTSGLKINTLFDVLLHRAFTGDLTAKWRETYMKELLAEMEAQAKALNERVVP